MKQYLCELIDISRTLGQDARLTQGGGGNSSVKTADGAYMLLKASGSAMKDMTTRRGWRRMDLSAVLAILKDTSLGKKEMLAREKTIANRLLQSCDDNLTSGRPSIEAHFHALLGRCTVHLHPTAAGPYICSRDGEQALAELFASQKRPPLWAPYQDLGYKSASALKRLVARYEKQHGEKPSVVFLQKHGVIFTADTPAQLLSLVQRTIGRCERGLRCGRVRKLKAPTEIAVRNARRALTQALTHVDGARPQIRYFFTEAIAQFLACDDAVKLARIGPLVPHEVSYAGGGPIMFTDLDATKMATIIQRRIDRDGYRPAAFLIADVGLFATGDRKRQVVVHDVVAASLETRMHLNRFGGAAPLTRRQRLFLDKVYTYKPT